MESVFGAVICCDGNCLVPVMLVVILSMFHETTETKGLEAMVSGCSICSFSDGTCAVDQLVATLVSLV